MKKNKATFVLLSVTLITSALTQTISCKKKKEENELITTVRITFRKAGVVTGIYTWKDPDGDGGQAPLPADSIKLDTGTFYSATLEFLDESSSAVKNVTDEIKTASKDHLVCFTPSKVGLNIHVTDSDGKFPLGLESDWSINETGKSSVRIVLRHQPGVKNGSCDPGDSDVDVEFPVISK